MADYYIRSPVHLYFHVSPRIAASLVQVSAVTTVGEQSTSFLGISGCDQDIVCCDRCQREGKDRNTTPALASSSTSPDLFTFLGKGESINNQISFTNSRILPDDNSHRLLNRYAQQNRKVIESIRIVCIEIRKTKGRSGYKRYKTKVLKLKYILDPKLKAK